MLFTEADLIHSYTRAQALDDGVLIDVSSLAGEAGFTVPVAVTSAVWEAHIAWPKDNPAQDETGRLWDILCMARLAIRRELNTTTDTLLFTVHQVPYGGIDRTLPVKFKMASHPGDQLEHVITIMLPDED